MAAKKDNTILWLAGIGVAGYLFMKYKDGTLQIPGVTPATPVAATPPAIQSTLMLPPSNAVNSNVPATPVSNAPATNAVNVTNLVPAQTSNGMLIPNQPLALNANGSPIINSNGMPMIFSPGPMRNSHLAQLQGGEGEIL